MLGLQLLTLLIGFIVFYGCEKPTREQVPGDPGSDEASIEPQVKFTGDLPADGSTSTSLSLVVKAGNQATTHYEWAWASGEGNCSGLSSYTHVADFNTKIEISDLGDGGSKIVCVKGKREDGTAQHTPLAHSWTKGEVSAEEEQEVEANLRVVVTAEGLSEGVALALNELSFTVEAAKDSGVTHYRYVFVDEPGDDTDTDNAIQKCRANTLTYSDDQDISESPKIDLSAQVVGKDGKKLLCVRGVRLETNEEGPYFAFWWEKSSKPTVTLSFDADTWEKFVLEHTVDKKKLAFFALGSGGATKFKYVLLEGDKYQDCATVDWGGVAVTEKELDITASNSSLYEHIGVLSLDNISALTTKNYKTLCLIGLNDTDTQATANRYTWSFRKRNRNLASPYYSKGSFTVFSSGSKKYYLNHIDNLGNTTLNYSVVLDEKSEGYSDFFAIKISNRANIFKSGDWQQVKQEKGETVIEGSFAAGETRYVRLKLYHNYKTDFVKDEHIVKLLLKVDGKDDVPIYLRLYVPQIEVTAHNTVITPKTHDVTLGNHTSSGAHKKLTIKNIGHTKSILAWQAFAHTLKHNWFYYTFKDSDGNRVMKSDGKAFAKLFRLKKDETAILQVDMSCRGNTSMSNNNCNKSLWPQQSGESVTVRIVSNGKSPSAADEEYPHVSGGPKVEERWEKENGSTYIKNEHRLRWRTDLYYDITYTGATP